MEYQYKLNDAGGSEHFGNWYWKSESGTVRGNFSGSQKFQIYDNSQFCWKCAMMQFFYDGSNTYLLNNTGNLFIRNDGSSTSVEEILIQPKGGEHSIRAIANQGVQLYYNNVKKFNTNFGSWQDSDVVSEPNVGNSDAGFRGYPEGSAVYLV